MKLCRLGSLDGCEDFDGAVPPICFERPTLHSKILESLNDGAEAREYIRLTIMEKTVVDVSEAREAAGGSVLCRRKRRGKKRSIFKIAKEPAEGVKGFRQMSTAAPIAATERGAIAGQTAERGRRAHRSAGVRADGSYRRALLHAGRSAA